MFHKFSAVALLKILFYSSRRITLNENITRKLHVHCIDCSLKTTNYCRKCMPFVAAIT